MIKVALSCGLYTTNEPYWEGSQHQYVKDTYVKAVLDAGATPVLIPTTDCRKAVSAVMEDCDGLILTEDATYRRLSMGKNLHQN